jgi:hypothetical protein
VLAAPPRGTLSIRVAKEIPGYVGSTHLVDISAEERARTSVAKGVNAPCGWDNAGGR